MHPSPPTRPATEATSRGILLLPLALSVLLGAAFSEPSLAQAQEPQGRVQTSKRLPPRLAEAKRLIDAQRPGAAIPVLKNFIRRSSATRHLDEAYLLLGAALTRTNAQEEAITYLDKLLSEFPKSDVSDRAQLLLAGAHAKLGNVDTALPLLAEVRSLSPDPQTRREALRLTGRLLTRKGDFLRAIQAWKEEMDLLPEEQQAAPLERIRQVIMEKLKRKDVLRLRGTYPGTFPSDLAMIRLIKDHLSRKEHHLAERHIHLFLEQFPLHEYAGTAKELLQSFRTALHESDFVVVAVLPLSRRLSPFGTEALRGIQLALDKAKEIVDMPSIALAVKDTESDKILLRSELRELLGEHRPLAVIGPMRSHTVQQLADLAEETETPFLTPAATLPNVRILGNFLFSTAMTYRLQARRVADYAMNGMGYYRFCILYPDTFYGRELSRLFAQEVRQRAGGIVAAESYKDTSTDFGVQIRRLKAIDLAGEGVMAELESDLKPESEKAMDQAPPRLTYSPGFDAIFVPATGKEVALLSTQLLFYDITVPLFGTDAWNSPDLLRLADPSLEGSVFVDGFYVDSLDRDVQDFVDRYRQRFRTSPSLFAAQAYDATRLVLEAVRRGATSAREVETQLRNARDLPTLGGPAGFDTGGVLNRQLVVLQVKQGKIVPAEHPNGQTPAQGEEPPDVR